MATTFVDSETPVLSPFNAALALVAIGILVIGYILLSMLLGIREYFAGFVFSLIWGAFYKSSFAEFPQVLAGSLLGVALCYFNYRAPLMIPHYGAPVALVVIVAAVYCMLVGRLKLFINNSTMVFLTICTVPEIQEKAGFGGIGAAVVLAAAYVGSITYILLKVKTHTDKRRHELAVG